jgi:hypothetical protein
VVAFNFIIDFSFNNRSAAAAETYVMELSDKVQANKLLYLQQHPISAVN